MAHGPMAIAVFFLPLGRSLDEMAAGATHLHRKPLVHSVTRCGASFKSAALVSI